MSVQRGLQLHQVDITTAFLNGKLDKDVYMKQPEGFTVTEKRSIYGLKQSPRCWNDVLDSHLKEMSFIQTTADPCIYRSTGGENAYLGVYVDDIVIAAKSNKQMKEIKSKLAERFDIKDLGKLRNFLGMKLYRNQMEQYGLDNLDIQKSYLRVLEWIKQKSLLLQWKLTISL